VFDLLPVSVVFVVVNRCAEYRNINVARMEPIRPPHSGRQITISAKFECNSCENVDIAYKAIIEPRKAIDRST